MWRNFDNWDTYKDLAGNPLRGCVQFNVKDGTTTAGIFDADGVTLANPQITDSMGRTAHQVFVSSDVRAYFYLYIGTGTLAEEEALGIDTSDQTKWALQYTVESAAVDIREVSGDSAMGVSTMSALRALDPQEVPLVDGVRAVSLLGYFEAGDKEPVLYFYEEQSQEPDDNGACIQPDGIQTGRWVMERPTEHCDSRHFGVFPQDSASSTANHATGITALVNYCNRESLRPFFNGSESYPYFPYSAITVNSRNPVDVSDRTVFVDRQASSFYGDFPAYRNFRFLNGLTHINSRDVMTSWNAAGFTGCERVIIDSQTPQAVFQDCEVVVRTGTAGKTFNNCRIVSDGLLGQNTFSKCQLTGAMFNNGSFTPTVDDTVELDVDDFDGRVALYLKMRNQQSSIYFDMKMRTVTGNWVTKDGVYWKDAIFDGATYSPATSVILDGCIGTLSLDISGQPVVYVKESTLTLSWSAGAPTLNIEKSSVALSSATNVPALALTATDSSLTGQRLDVGSDVSLSGCSVGCALGIGGALDANGCSFTGEVIHAPTTAVLTVNLTGNRILSHYTMAPQVGSTVVMGNIIGNYGAQVNPVVVNRTNMLPNDSQHSYKYEGNTGTFLPDVSARKAANVTVHWDSVRTLTPVARGIGQYELVRLAEAGVTGVFNGYTGPNSPNAYPFEPGVNFFRIGSDPFRVGMEIKVVGGNYLSAGAACMQVLKATLVAGYTWQLTAYLTGETWAPDQGYWLYSDFPTYYNPVCFAGQPTGQPGTDYTLPVEIQYTNLDARH